MRTLTTTQILRETLAEELRRDPLLFLMGEDIGAYGGAFGVTRGLLKEFGAARIRDTPISEAGFIGAAIGAAVAGSHPVVEIMFMDFITLCVDQLVNMAAKVPYIYGLACPLVIRAPMGGGRGYGATHSQCLERLFFGVPGLRIAAPATGADAAGLLRGALRENNPVIFLEHKLLYPMRWELDDAPIAPLPLGRARVARAGTDVTIVAWSWMSVEAERAAATLAREEIEAEVIDLRSLSPLDTQTLVASARKTGRVLVVEEGPLTGGLAAEISARVTEAAFHELAAPVRRLTLPDCPLPAARSLENALLPGADAIAAAARDLATLV
ncbi:MAG: pyruvate dehydrogenase complex E1 component subunit beta [Kiritimatiellae bacterium]|nr:pyruvate dehydrogenase complex E1 component subunit beta [Kiritimatiellia bacterium]